MEKKMQKKGARDEIREAALELFAEYGFEATSIGEIAKSAGVPKANVLYYFSDKAELWKAAVDEHWKEVDAFYGERLPAKLPPDRQSLKQFLLVYLEACCRFPPYVQIMNLEGHAKTWRNKWLATKHLKRHIEGAEVAFAELIATEKVRNKNTLLLQTLMTGGGQLLIGQHQLWVEAAKVDPRDPEFRETYAEEILDLILK